MTARDTAAVVGALVESLTATERYLLDREPWARDMFAIATEAALGDGTARTAVRSPQPLSHVMASQIVSTAQDVAVRRLWQRHRIAYDLDPALWEELGEVDEDMTLPGSVFDHLPHPDPFIAWPPLPPHHLADGHAARAVGCFVTGRSGVRIPDPDTLSGPDTALGWPVSTHSPHATSGVVITIMSNVEDRPGHLRRLAHMGGIPDCLIARVTLNLRGDVRVGDLIDQIAARYHEGVERGSFERTVRPTLRRIIAALLYLCATNADLRPLPAASARRGARTVRNVKPPKVLGVGHVVGAGLRAWRRRLAVEQSATPTGRQVRPHVRRAHPHLYWTGPGRTVARVRWVFPVQVNAHQPTTRTDVQPIRRTTQKETATS